MDIASCACSARTLHKCDATPLLLALFLDRFRSVRDQVEWDEFVKRGEQLKELMAFHTQDIGDSPSKRSVADHIGPSPSRVAHPPHPPHPPRDCGKGESNVGFFGGLDEER